MRETKQWVETNKHIVLHYCFMAWERKTQYDARKGIASPQNLAQQYMASFLVIKHL